MRLRRRRPGLNSFSSCDASIDSRMDPTPLTDTEYEDLSRKALASIEATVDRLLQGDVIDIDAQRTGGLLELRFPSGSTIVVNTQPPLHELWLAARGGGFHFKHVGSRWIDREGQEFFAVLSRCASEQAGQPLEFSPP
jgi:CyaY protein